MIEMENTNHTGYLMLSKAGLASDSGKYKLLFHPAIRAIIRYNSFANSINSFKKWLT